MTQYPLNGSDAETDGGSNWQRQLALAGGVVAIVLLTAAAAATFLAAPDVFCLLFLASVFGVFLRQCGVWTGRITRLGTGAGIAIVVVTLVAASAGSLWLTGGLLADKVREAADELETTVRESREILRQYPVANSIVTGIPGLGELLEKASDEANSSTSQGGTSNSSLPQANGDNSTGASESRLPDSLPVGQLLSGEVASRAASVGGKALGGLLKIFGTTFGALTSIAVVFFVGLFLAIDPELYVSGFRSLVPEDRRDAYSELMARLGRTIWAWLLGRFGTMLITGTGVWVVMALLGVPLAPLLGLFTALMVFIPNIGAVIAVALAVLLALPKGIGVVAAVVIAYTAFQLLEGYVLTPIIQQKAVKLPPALLIASQLVLGVLFGFLGVMVATPFVAVAIVLTQAVVVEDRFALFDQQRTAST